MKTFKEALDLGGEGEHLFNPQKRRWYKDPREVERTFPETPKDLPRHMETITSGSFKQAIAKLKHYGIEPNQANPMSLLQQVMGAMQRVSQIQAPHTKKLEEMALKIVLDLPEFAIFKDEISSGRLKIDAKFAKPSIAKTPPEKEEEDEQEGELEVEEVLADELKDIDDKKLRRQFGRMMTQGNAVNKLYLFNLATEELNKINPNLVNLYGILSSIVQVAYYVMPEMNAMGGDDDEFREAAEESAVGSVQIIPNPDGTYTLKARSYYFPYLVHEIVKGFYEYLTMDLVSNEELEQETVAQELIEIMSGPQLYANFSKLIPANKVALTPIVYKLLLREPINSIKAVVAGGGQAHAVINKLLVKAEQQMKDYEQGEYTENEPEGEPDTGEEPEGWSPFA